MFGLLLWVSEGEESYPTGEEPVVEVSGLATRHPRNPCRPGFVVRPYLRPLQKYLESSGASHRERDVHKFLV